MNASQIWKGSKISEGNISNENLMIHILNNLCGKYNMISNGLGNHLMLSGHHPYES